jgi:hypothetical protein
LQLLCKCNLVVEDDANAEALARSGGGGGGDGLRAALPGAAAARGSAAARGRDAAPSHGRGDAARHGAGCSARSPCATGSSVPTARERRGCSPWAWCCSPCGSCSARTPCRVSRGRRRRSRWCWPRATCGAHGRLARAELAGDRGWWISAHSWEIAVRHPASQAGQLSVRVARVGSRRAPRARARPRRARWASAARSVGARPGSRRRCRAGRARR